MVHGVDLSEPKSVQTNTIRLNFGGSCETSGIRDRRTYIIECTVSLETSIFISMINKLEFYSSKNLKDPSGLHKCTWEFGLLIPSSSSVLQSLYIVFCRLTKLYILP